MVVSHRLARVSQVGAHLLRRGIREGEKEGGGWVWRKRRR